MIKCNLHTHSTFCDGNDKIEDTVLCAIEKGFDAQFTVFDENLQIVG